MKREKFSASLSRRYAKALLNVSLKNKIEDKIEEELCMLSNLIQNNKKFANLLTSPIVSRDEKIHFVENVLKFGFHPVTIQFVKLLLLKRREYGLVDVQLEYSHQLILNKKYLHIQVKTTIELSAKHKSNLEKKVEAVSGKKVFAEYQIDPYIIGGIQVRYEDFIHGGSVRDALFRMKELWMKDLVK